MKHSWVEACFIAAGTAFSIKLIEWLLHEYYGGYQRGQRDFQPARSLVSATDVEGKKSMGSQEAKKALDEEQFSRIRTFFGDAGYQQIQDAFVVVVGLGGVGSHAAHMLVRSGVRKIRIIDFDNVTLSSLNRHAVATREDVGLSKVKISKKHFQRINPSCEVEDIQLIFDESCAKELLSGNPAFVVDCIDDVQTKISLLSTASEMGLKIITATGAGGKMDPTSIHIGDLTDAIHDPLAVKIRYYLRKKNIDMKQIITVYSSEKICCPLLPLDTDQVDNPNQYGNVENFRIRVMPVLGTTPALFGQSMAAYVLTQIGEKPFNPITLPKLPGERRKKMYQKFHHRETKVYNADPKEMLVSSVDVDFIHQCVWRGRSAISGTRMGGCDRMVLSRWRPDKPATPYNVVLLTAREEQLLDRVGFEEAFNEETKTRIDTHLASFGEW